MSCCASIMMVKYEESHGFLCNTDVRQKVIGITVPPLKRVPSVSTEAQITYSKRNNTTKQRSSQKNSILCFLCFFFDEGEKDEKDS